jgi:hypothetical protein
MRRQISDLQVDINQEYFLFSVIANSIDRTSSFSSDGIEASQNLKAVPHLGWANAVPNALATVDLSVKGSALKFEGVSRHDKVSKKLIVS